MDEITPASGLSNVTVDGSDNNPLAVLIGGLIDDCALEIFSVAPYWRLPWTTFTAASVEVKAIANPTQRKIIRLKLSNDFLRIAEIDCPDFQRPVTEIYAEHSDMGKRQHNRHLLAKEAKPVGVFSHGVWTESSSQVTKREINCYSLDPSSTTTAAQVVASYIKKPQSSEVSGWDAETVITLPLLPALEWLIASKTFAARGDAEHAAICQQNAQNLLV